MIECKYTKIKGLDSREITSLPKSRNVINIYTSTITNVLVVCR